MKKAYSGAITIIYVLLMTIFWQTVSADESYKDSQNSLKRGDFDRAITQANKSIQKNPREPRYYYGRAKTYLATTVNLNEEAKQEYKALALVDLKTAQTLNQKNLVTYRNIIPLYYFLGINDLQQNSPVNNLDQTYVGVVKNYFQSVKHYSPNDVGIYALLAKYESRMGLQKNLQISLDNVERLRPDLLEWYVIQ